MEKSKILSVLVVALLSLSAWADKEEITDGQEFSVLVSGITTRFCILNDSAKTVQVGNGREIAVPAAFAGTMTIPATVKVADIVEAIHENSDVQDFKARFAAVFEDFKRMLHIRLIDNVEQVKEVVESDIISADIFRRCDGMPLVDKYAAYQILADNWQGIMGDVEIIQTEGFGACNVVEPKMKMVKDKNGVEQEVEDGLKGRIIPFELVQKTLFQEDLDAIASLQSRIEAIDGELDAARDELLSMDDTEKYFDAEKDNAFVKKEILIFALFCNDYRFLARSASSPAGFQ